MYNAERAVRAISANVMLEHFFPLAFSFALCNFKFGTARACDQIRPHPDGRCHQGRYLQPSSPGKNSFHSGNGAKTNNESSRSSKPTYQHEALKLSAHSSMWTCRPHMFVQIQQHSAHKFQNVFIQKTTVPLSYCSLLPCAPVFLSHVALSPCLPVTLSLFRFAPPSALFPAPQTRVLEVHNIDLSDWFGIHPCMSITILLLIEHGMLASVRTYFMVS